MKTHYPHSTSGKNSSQNSRNSSVKASLIVNSQEDDSVTDSVDSYQEQKKIFKVSKMKKENLILLRNKIPKVFNIQKYKKSSHLRDSCSNNTSSIRNETPIRKVYGDVFKIELFREKRKRLSIRPLERSRIQDRICNDYSDEVEFKIEKVRRFKPLKGRLSLDNLAKPEDIDSASTKRSSRQSSKQKESSDMSNCLPEVEPINLVKIQENEDSLMMKVTPETLPFENELFLRCKNLNEELESELPDYNIPDQLSQEILDLQPSLEQLHKQIECESNNSYHEDDLN